MGDPMQDLKALPVLLSSSILASLVFSMLPSTTVRAQQSDIGSAYLLGLGGPGISSRAQAEPFGAEIYGRLPLIFEANRGQADRQAKFLARGRGYVLFLKTSEIVLELQPHPLATRASTSDGSSSPGCLLRLAFDRTNPAATLLGTDELAGHTHYFIGNDPRRWHSDVPLYAAVRQEGIYRGVDVVYHGNQREMEYDLVVGPGGDPSAVRLLISGADTMLIDDEGNLVLRTRCGDLTQRSPLVYYERGGVRHVVASSYIVLPDAPSETPDDSILEIGFKVAAYDRTQQLTIDPLLSFSTFLGGTGEDEGQGIAVDSFGNTYVTGYTTSVNFPLSDGVQGLLRGTQDAFVTKLTPAGNALAYSTYLGGSGVDGGAAIAVDGSGSAYVTGGTFSSDFPTVNAFQATPAAAGHGSAFIAKLTPAGDSLVYSTYLHATGVTPTSDSSGAGIAVGGDQTAYVIGNTNATTFPTLNALQPTLAGDDDAFVLRLAQAGNALVYSTYLGGQYEEEGCGIAVDASGSAYVTGSTSSPDFPVVNPLPGQGPPSSVFYTKAFVSKIAPGGSSLTYSTYLGGSNTNYGLAIAADPMANAYVTGYTNSVDFPTQNAAQTWAPFLNYSAFVTKIATSGNAFVYSTYLGNTGMFPFGLADALGVGIAADRVGNAYVTGYTNSRTFPVTLTDPLQVMLDGPTGLAFVYLPPSDAFVTKFSANGAFAYSTYLGGRYSDAGRAIAVDSVGDAYVTGRSASPDFPVTFWNAAQPLNNGGGYAGDAFVAKISDGVRVSLSQ